MWADAQRDGRPAEYIYSTYGALCESSLGLIPFIVPRRKVWLRPAAGVPCSNAAIYENARLGRKVNIACDKFSSGGKSVYMIMVIIFSPKNCVLNILIYRYCGRGCQLFLIPLMIGQNVALLTGFSYAFLADSCAYLRAKLMEK